MNWIDLLVLATNCMGFCLNAIKSSFKTCFMSPRLTHCHLPELSRKHGMIPDQYVMPWKEDMKNRHFALKVVGAGNHFLLRTA